MGAKLVSFLLLIGLSLGDNLRSMCFWILVVEKIQKRLLLWKKGFLLPKGKIGLNSVGVEWNPVILPFLI